MELTIILSAEQEAAIAERVAAILAERQAESQAPRACYTVEEAAEILSCSPETIRRRVRAGLLPTLPLQGRVVRIPGKALFPAE